MNLHEVWKVDVRQSTFLLLLNSAEKHVPEALAFSAVTSVMVPVQCGT